MIKKTLKLIDIAVNLTDPMFHGIYGGKQIHQDDFHSILQRAFNIGIEKIIITAGNLKESKEALELSRKNERLFSTVGVHPTRCKEFVENEKNYIEELLKIIQDGLIDKKIVAVGEFGLDYDRLQFCPIDIQKKYFEKQFILSEESKLPLFLHMRNSSKDFFEIIKRNRNKFTKGIVHSFTGNLNEAQEIINLDLFIGLNGCSLKTKENLEVVKHIPINRILLETDAPWCEIKTTHAGFNSIKTFFPVKDKKKWAEGYCVKSRNEPCHIVQVLEIIADCKQMPIEELAEQVYENTCKVLPLFPSI